MSGRGIGQVGLRAGLEVRQGYRAGRGEGRARGQVGV